MNQDKINDLERRLKILSISISDAIEAVQVWRVLIAPETHDKYKTQLGIYAPFFKATRQAVFVSTVTSLGRFSDKTKKVVSAPNILRDLKKHKFETNKVKKIEEIYNQNSEAWGNIKILRNSIFSHSTSHDVLLGEQQVFSNSKITPDEISESVFIARYIVVELHSLLKIEDFRLNKVYLHRVRLDTEKLFSNLKKGREARLKE